MEHIMPETTSLTEKRVADYLANLEDPRKEALESFHSAHGAAIKEAWGRRQSIRPGQEGILIT